MSTRILLVQQEWPRDFRRSTQWSYISSLGYLEALEACGARTTLLTTPWLVHARRLIAAGEFDQVWVIDLAHLDATDEFFGWLETVAPVRVGLLGESLQHTEQEIQDTPSLAGREARVRSRSRSFTHLLLADEADARSFTRAGKPTLWSPGGMLRRFIIAESEVQPSGPVGFIGDVYAKRVRFFGDPEIRGRVQRIVPQDRTPDLERRYLELAVDPERIVGSDAQLHALHSSYNERLRELQSEIFTRYLACLRGLGATINPPSIVKTYPGRVYEASSQGVPVITWRIPNRPGNDRLFELGHELLAFEDGDLGSLRRAIDHLITDREAARALAVRARKRLLADHTLETRCAAALRFISETRVS